jgi:hypothetical protein
MLAVRCRKDATVRCDATHPPPPLPPAAAFSSAEVAVGSTKGEKCKILGEEGLCTPKKVCQQLVSKDKTVDTDKCPLAASGEACCIMDAAEARKYLQSLQ